MNASIRWMASHPVAANLLMVFIIVAGVVSAYTVKQEAMPEFSLGTIEVRVEYQGASPEEIEESILLRIEERLEGVDQIKRISSVANPNVGAVRIVFVRGADIASKLDEVKSEMDLITTFPDLAEEPEIRELTNRQRALEVAVFGDSDERQLKEIANRLKDELVALDDVSLVEISSVRDYEISIEVDNATLRQTGLTIPELANRVRRQSLDLPGGELSTSEDEVNVRTVGQNYNAREFAAIPVLRNDLGGQVRLGEIATINDGFEDRQLVSRFNGKPAVLMQVLRVGDEHVLDVVNATRAHLRDEFLPSLPPGISAQIWRNDAEELETRLSLLRVNGFIAMVLVVSALALFLNLRLALWVSVGIAIAFVGVFPLMQYVGLSVNAISAFGLILAIGIVVDDAIVVGENIYASRQSGVEPLQAAISGTQRVATPVVFAVATTIVAFIPLLIIPGPVGSTLGNVPAVVILILALSIIECLFILPKHLSHSLMHQPAGNRVARFVLGVQDATDRLLRRFIEGRLDRALRFVTEHWVVTLTGAFAVLLCTFGIIRGGHVKVEFFPVVESRYVTATIGLPDGVSATKTQQALQAVEAAATELGRELADEFGMASSPVTSWYSVVGMEPVGSNPARANVQQPEQPHLGGVVVELIVPEEREFTAEEFKSRWRARVGEIPGVDRLLFSADFFSFGAPIELRLSSRDDQRLRQAVRFVRSELSQINGVFDLRDDFESGRLEMQISIKDRASSYGLDLQELAAQVRGALFGTEAVRVQRGKEEVRVYVRLPASERNALGDLRDYRIRTPEGGYVPLAEVADIVPSKSRTTIRRNDGRKTVTITGDVDPAIVTGPEASDYVRSVIGPLLEKEVPGVELWFGGEQEEIATVVPSLSKNFLFALIAIYALLAIPFGSYTQPIVVMAAIPFGLSGAMVGHLVLGLNFSMPSVIGFVGLSGVIVNGSLVLIDFANEEQRRGKPRQQALIDAAKGRFRPILLTAVTTFLGVSPLIFDQSVQGQFLVPLATSLGFGVLLGTAILMLVVPALAMAQACWFGDELPAETPRDLAGETDA